MTTHKAVINCIFQKFKENHVITFPHEVNDIFVGFLDFNSVLNDFMLTLNFRIVDKDLPEIHGFLKLLEHFDIDKVNVALRRICNNSIPSNNQALVENTISHILNNLNEIKSLASELSAELIIHGTKDFQLNDKLIMLYNGFQTKPFTHEHACRLSEDVSYMLAKLKQKHERYHKLIINELKLVLYQKGNFDRVFINNLADSDSEIFIEIVIATQNTVKSLESVEDVIRKSCEELKDNCNFTVQYLITH